MVISFPIKSDNVTEIILDTNFISFKECISIFESLRNKRLTFKILPKKANFLIGSKNNKERGEIIEFS